MSSEATISDLIHAGEEALREAAFCTGDFSQTQALLSEARESAKQSRNRRLEAAAADRLALALHYRTIGQLMQGLEAAPADVDSEESLFRHALSVRELEGDLAGVAQSSFGIGLVFQVLRRDWDAAMPFYWRALEIVEESGKLVDLYTRSEVHRHVGFYYLAKDVRVGDAISHLQRSLELREQMHEPRVIPSALVALGEAELEAGHSERAVVLLEEAVLVGRRAGVLAQRVQDAEQAAHKARAALRAQQAEAHSDN